VSSLPQDVGECKVAVDGGDWRSVPVLEDLDYQAATHGGRRVEAIIFGRPVAADALAAAGISSMVGAVFVRRWEPSLALALSGVALLGAAAAVEADADCKGVGDAAGQDRLYRIRPAAGTSFDQARILRT
jgi:hypothetical protein